MEAVAEKRAGGDKQTAWGRFQVAASTLVEIVTIPKWKFLWG